MRKKRVGIITWHYYPNFGSCLQSYGLQCLVKELGYKPQIINYRNKKYGNVNALKLKIRYYFRFLFKHRDPFLEFHYKYLFQTKLVQDEGKLKFFSRKFYAVICGSDQIWAPNVLNSIYLLSFVEGGKKKIAYAASIGLNYIPIELDDVYKILLTRFYRISLREESGALLLYRKYEINANVVLDPTFILHAEHWRRLEIRANNCPQKFVFVYFLNSNNNYKESVVHCVKSFDDEIEIVGISANNLNAQWMKQLTGIGPREFLWLIDNAEAVITDSYHGTIFSLLFHKIFLTIKRFDDDSPICQNSRIYQLNKYFSLEKNICDINRPMEFNREFDYQEFERRLKVLRKKSIDFLREALE